RKSLGRRRDHARMDAAIAATVPLLRNAAADRGREALRAAVHETNSLEAPLHCFTIWPHRSLGAGGLKVLLGIIAAGLALVALRSPPQAFWPIAFGCGLTFAAVSAAFLCNMR